MVQRSAGKSRGRAQAAATVASSLPAQSMNLIVFVVVALVLYCLYRFVTMFANAGEGAADLFGAGARGDGKQCDVSVKPRQVGSRTLRAGDVEGLYGYFFYKQAENDGSCAACKYGYRREASRTFCCNSNESCPKQFFSAEHVKRIGGTDAGAHVITGEYNPQANEAVCGTNVSWQSPDHCNKCAYGYKWKGMGIGNHWCCNHTEQGCTKLLKA